MMTATATAPAHSQTSGNIPAPKSEFGVFSLAAFRESPLNPRKHFDVKKLAELTESVRQSGILTPVTARMVHEKGKGGQVDTVRYELAAGHRRYRAAKAAGLLELPAVIREMSDEEFLEILNVENLQRDDIHPLEEAQGYKMMLGLEGYDIKKLAGRVGKSESYVYDRLKLLQLVKEAQKLFLANRFSAGHAILLARLSKTDQERCLDVDNENSYGSAVAGGMWQHEGPSHPPLGLEDPSGIAVDESEEDYRHLKPVSVRELQAWIDDHIRFTEPDPSTPHLFPETAENLALAEAKKLKVIHISRDHQVKEDARDPDGQRTFSVVSWVRADGQPELEDWSGKEKPSKTCDRSVMGLVVAGRGRGESFLVCVDRKRCTVHFADVIKERNKREREREKEPKASKSTKASSDEPKQPSEKDLAKQKAQELRDNAQWDAEQKAEPAVWAAITKAIKAAPTGSRSPIANFLWNEIEEGMWGLDDKSKKAAKHGVPEGTNAADFVRHLAMCFLVSRAEDETVYEIQGELDQLKLGVKTERIAAPFVKAAIAAVDAKIEADAKAAKAGKK